MVSVPPPGLVYIESSDSEASGKEEKEGRREKREGTGRETREGKNKGGMGHWERMLRLEREEEGQAFLLGEGNVKSHLKEKRKSVCAHRYSSCMQISKLFNHPEDV